MFGLLRSCRGSWRKRDKVERGRSNTVRFISYVFDRTATSEVLEDEYRIGKSWCVLSPLTSLEDLPLNCRKGCLTEYRLFKETAVVACPSYLTDEEACNMQIAGTTAWMAINGMRPLGQPGGKGESILLQGTGGVSIMGLLMGKASGAESKSQVTN